MRRQLTALLTAALGVSLATAVSGSNASAESDNSDSDGVVQRDKGATPASHRAIVTVQQDLSDYWTPERMRDAIQTGPIRVSEEVMRRAAASATLAPVGAPLKVEPQAPAISTTSRTGSTKAVPRRATSGERWDHPGTAVAKTSGRLFYTLRGEDRVCSAGVVVAGKKKNVLATAGHCVYSDTKPRRWSRNMYFVPGFKNWHEPYGRYDALKMWTTGQWFDNRKAFRHDVGFVRVDRSHGRHVAYRVGAQGVWFNSPGTPWTDEFGYPSKRPQYQGKYLIHCAGNSKWARSWNQKMYRVRCRMNQGSSGGPWLRKYKSEVYQFSNVSLVSFAKDHPKYNWGPYWDDSVKRAWKAARGKK